MNGGDNEDDEHEQIKRPRSKSQPVKLSLQSLDDQAEHTNTQQKKMSAIQNSLGRMRNLKKKVGRPKKQVSGWGIVGVSENSDGVIIHITANSFIDLIDIVYFYFIRLIGPPICLC